MEKQLFRILLSVVILIGSINLSARYLVQNEAIALKALTSNSTTVKEKEESSTNNQQKKNKIINKSRVELKQ
ncbi:MAG: hypothetical protein KAS62_09365 [Candidatus Delongbacteria bacterium]|nr:hypothetical protein [Candidatus Delongbacteria bacterium]